MKGAGTAMQKKVVIEGMMCQHCRARAEQALNAIPGASAAVDLESGTAVVAGDVSDEDIRAAVAGAGYRAVSIS